MKNCKNFVINMKKHPGNSSRVLKFNLYETLLRVLIRI